MDKALLLIDDEGREFIINENQICAVFMGKTSQGKPSVCVELSNGRAIYTNTFDYELWKNDCFARRDT